MSENLKKLTGKNKYDYEAIASLMLNKPDIDLFKELVYSDDYLFDFIKENVAKRLENACNKDNYMNLLKFMKYYSPYYEDFIVSVLVRYANEDLTDQMLNLLEYGTEEEKTYSAKYFNFIHDPLALEFLNKYAYSEYSNLSTNCISALASFGERGIYDSAIENLNSADEFEVLEAVKILISYGDVSALPFILKVIKHSSFAESIAAEIPYLCDLEELLNNNDEDGLYVLNQILNGLGETVALAQVMDYKIYNILDLLINSKITSKIAVVLLNAKERFETLTENEEYLYDESKDVKQEIYDIKSLLKSISKEKLKKYISDELNSESLFVFTALDYADNTEKIRQLLHSKNQTIILKAVEVLKSFKILNNTDKETALQNITSNDIINIIKAI